MSLINCPECKKEISNQAPTCPQCGCLIAGNKTESITGLSAIFVVVGMILSVILFCLLVKKIENTLIVIIISVIPTILAFALSSLRKK